MRYYLSVQENDLIKAKDLSDQLLTKANASTRVESLNQPSTDQKLTNSPKNRGKSPIEQSGKFSEQLDNA